RKLFRDTKKPFQILVFFLLKPFVYTIFFKIELLQKTMQKMEHSGSSAGCGREFQQIKFIFLLSKSEAKSVCCFSDRTSIPFSAAAASTTFAKGIPFLKI